MKVKSGQGTLTLLAPLLGRANLRRIHAGIVLSVLAGALPAGSGAITDAALLLQVWSMACFAALLFGGIWLARRRAGDSAR